MTITELNECIARGVRNHLLTQEDVKKIMTYAEHDMGDDLYNLIVNCEEKNEKAKHEAERARKQERDERDEHWDNLYDHLL